MEVNSLDVQGSDVDCWVFCSNDNSKSESAVELRQVFPESDAK